MVALDAPSVRGTRTVRGTPTPPDTDAAGWERALDLAVREPDPVEANLLITQAHHELGLALRRHLGADSGANFHAWATWGSREAGTTIRRDDVPGLRRLALARPALARARDAISAGNRLVLDDIGRATARFVTVDEMRGDGLLGTAFTNYAAAARAPDADTRRALTFRANYQAVWHEHERLQTHIAAAMPRGLRHLITRTLLDFRVGAARLHVGRDLTPGSAARDWSRFEQRMRYVHELFRTRHLDADVFAPPYDLATTRRLRAALGFGRS